ncbi:alpha-tocopherol transfer protein-like protein [Trichonephila clavipes]|nr:alpha-tocopherol transfer protein-like protein [Trichonephila clavipes]
MDTEMATVLRGRAKAALTRTKNFIDKDDQTFDKNDIRNKGLLLLEPANIIKHIPITETAYNEAWEKLLARYDKKKQIIFSLIETIMEQPSFNDTNSHNLCNITDTSDEVIRGLKSIDTKAESRDELPSTSNHRDRWELLQNIKRGFWKKWSSKCISSLQPRKQWQDAQPNLKEHDIVSIKEERPPGTWPMAPVLRVHPGNDELVRVATVKTQDSVLKRLVHKVHKLPIYLN